MRDRQPAAVSRLGPCACAARVVVGRRPPRRLAAVGPRPPRARDAWPGGRPAAARRQRRSPGPGGHDEVAPAPQHRAQRRPERRRRPPRARARLAAGDLATPAAAGRSTWRPVPTTSRPDPTARSASSARAPISPPTRPRGDSIRGSTAGLLAIEGAHALDGDPANVEVVADAGFRMMSPSHFFDNAFGGSAHGIEKGGLTDAGREMVERMEARGMLVDVAHASAATIDDILAIAARPVVASHTGLRGVADNARNLTDDQARGIAATGGLARDRVLADRLRRRRRGRDRPGDPLRGRCRRHRTRRARLGLRWRGARPVRCERSGPADRRTHRRRIRRRRDRQGDGRQRAAPPRRRPSLIGPADRLW